MTNEKNTIFNIVMKKVLKNKSTLIFVICLLFVGIGLSQVIPYLQGLIVNNASAGIENKVLEFGFIIVGISLISVLCQFYQNRFMYKLAYKIANDMREEIFNALLKQNTLYFEMHSVAYILQRTTSYVNDIGNTIAKDVMPFIVGIFKFVFVLIFLLFISLPLGFLFLGIFVLIAIFILIYSNVLAKFASKYKDSEIKRNSLILNNINGFETLLAYNQDNLAWQEYDDVSRIHFKNRNKFYLLHTSFPPIAELCWHLSSILIYVLCFIFISNGLYEIGLIVAVLTYGSQLVSPLSAFANGINMFAKIEGTADKVLDIYNIKNKTSNKEELIINNIYNIKCENISFIHEYKGNIIKNINLLIKNNNKILIRGAYGSGKSSLAYLIAGLYVPTTGSVYINNQNINNTILPFDTIGMLSDKITVYQNTIFENVKIAKPSASDSEVMNAIKLSSLDKWVDTLPKKEKTNIDKKQISHGDKQLLGFARLILQNPKIIIIDEASRNLDLRAKKRFLKILNDFCNDKTLIYISAYDDVESSITFDKKYILKNGKIIKLNN